MRQQRGQDVVSGLRRKIGQVESEGERIYYEVTGTGPPVVLCHGLGGNHAIWWQQVEAFSAEHTLIVWDQRGFGNSTTTTGEIGTVAATRDLVALLDHLELSCVDVVGQSMGGWVALGLALKQPGRVRSLVLSTTLAGADQTHVDRLVADEPDRTRFNRREHPVLSADFCREHPDLGVLYNQISSFGSRPDPAEVLAIMAREGFDSAALNSLPVQTLVLMASSDDLCPPSAMAGVAASLPHGALLELDGDHSLFYEQPDLWNRAVLDFLDRT